MHRVGSHTVHEQKCFTYHGSLGPFGTVASTEEWKEMEIN